MSCRSSRIITRIPNRADPLDIDSGEEKPSCQRCLSTGRVCEGYEDPPPKKLTSKEVVQRSGFTPIQPLVLSEQPSLDIQAGAAERRSFHFIQAKGLTDIFGRCEFELWDIMIPRLSHSHQIVQQSLIALGAIYEVYEQKSEFQNARILEDRERNALQQYNKAVNSVSLSLGVPDVDKRGVLMSCLIFSRIEMMLNNTTTAKNHLASGINILTELKKTSGQQAGEGGDSFANDPDHIYESLLRDFFHMQFELGIELDLLQELGLVGKSSAEGQDVLPVAVESKWTNIPPLAKFVHAVAGPQCDRFILHENKRQPAVDYQPPTEEDQDRATGLSEVDKRRSLSLLYIRSGRVLLTATQKSLLWSLDSELGSAFDPFEDVVGIVEEIYTKRQKIGTVTTLDDQGVIPNLFFVLLVSI